ncbi:CcdC protein domain-containing protein [Phenylobacterium deserti]|uniref:DUF1453 domain-containing protein n=1 Tax=Phenylobacterium deserti TaxID=1914756 RepID=A0A328ABH3_9CAUL|nr:CcdC protein domain-containing protein [Phenylobacterium deserti]RAK52072.1 hypothetical protein DJ018_13025 [Phenylobacterium deserti]
MDQTYGSAAGPWPYLIPLVIIALALLRNARSRRLRVERLWVGPVLILLAAALAITHTPSPGFVTFTAWSLAFIAGSALGWWRGRFTHITVDAETHALTSRTSPLGLLLILAVFAIRALLRGALADNAASLHVSLAEISDGFLLFAVGVVCTHRLEIALRATRLLKEARAARSAA